MIIRLEWKVEGYWLECSEDEAITQIYPRLDKDLVDKSYKEANKLPDSFLKECGLEPTNKYCFLVSGDISSIEPFSPYYPYHHAWNAYSPFENYPETTIRSLEEILTLS